MSHEPFSLFHHSVLILLDRFSVMMHCISYEASTRANINLTWVERGTLNIHTGECIRLFAGIYAYCRYYYIIILSIRHAQGL